MEEEHEEHVNHEAWVIPYADMLTLLMALFLVLFAISSVDLAKFKALADNLNMTLGGPGAAEPSIVAVEGATGVLEGGENPIALQLTNRQSLAEEALQQQEAQAQAVAVEQASLGEVERLVGQVAENAGLGHSVQLRQEARGLIIAVVADDVLFHPGSAELQAGGRAVMAQIVEVLRGLPNQLAVEGHTDSRPINTAQFPTNWELSTGRATSVLRFLVDDLHFDPQRVSASGYGDRRPIGDNATVEGRATNRRVEIAVLTEFITGVAPAGAVVETE